MHWERPFGTGHRAQAKLSKDIFNIENDRNECEKEVPQSVLCKDRQKLAFNCRCDLAPKTFSGRKMDSRISTEI